MSSEDKAAIRRDLKFPVDPHATGSLQALKRMLEKHEEEKINPPSWWRRAVREIFNI